MTITKILSVALALGLATTLTACNKPQTAHQPASPKAASELDITSTLIAIEDNRQRVSQNWQYLENATKDLSKAKTMNDWEAINLPHTWNANDTTDVITGYRRDGSWYRKAVTLEPQSDKRYFLHFEAAQMKASVYVNGKNAGSHVGGYVSFDIEISEHLVAGENEIFVRVDNGIDKNLVPSQKADFFKYGGLTRDVWIMTTPQNRLKQVRVNTPDVSKKRALITLNPITDTNDNLTGQIYRSTITAPSGDIVARGEALEFTVENPALWSPDQQLSI
jgi:beta-galactosidase